MPESKMYKFRAKSQILWDNGGYREHEAVSAEAAMNYFNKLEMRVTKDTLEIYSGGRWVIYSKI